MALTAAERREAARREPILKVGEVLLAHREVVREIDDARRRLVARDAPFASQLGSLALDILAQRFHFTKKGAEALQIACGFSSHGRRFGSSESSTGVMNFPVKSVFDAQM